MAVEQTIDEVEIAGAAAPGANGERAGEMRFSARCESGNLLVPDMDPFDLVLPADRIGDPVQAVANDAIDALDASRCQGVGELICNRNHNDQPFLPLRTRSTMAMEFPT